MLLTKRSVFYSATALVKVTRDKIDLPELKEFANLAKASETVANDTVFLETEIAVVKSDATLNAVATQLKLNEAWAERLNRGQPLEGPQTFQWLKQRVDARSGGGDGLIEIDALSEVPEEAAEIANAVSQAYCEYRVDYRRRLTQRALNAVTAEHTSAEQKISASQVKMEQAWQQLDPELRELATTNASATDGVMRTVQARFSASLLRYLAASNQLALFPATNPANAEIITELQNRADQAKAELTQAQNATQTEMRRAESLKRYQAARFEFEDLKQRYAPLKKTVEDLTNQLRPQSQPPATIVEPATVPTSPEPRSTNRNQWILPAAGVSLLLGIALLAAGRGSKRALA